MLKIISGGQTGADRTGLEVARELDLPTGGWVPLGWKTDEGPDPTLAEFGCIETSDYGYRNRTLRNIQDADATVWFGDPRSPGGRLTLHYAIDVYKRPTLVNPRPIPLWEWLALHEVKVLNVAGNRRRTNPQIVEQVRSVLVPALRVYLGLDTVQA